MIDKDSPRQIYRRWANEICLGEKRMKTWREKCKKTWDIYHGDSINRLKNSYNILYANTEILAPSVYNSLPTPDVRRRFAKKDDLGKAVSDILNKALSFNAETTGFDNEVRLDILDMLIIGRGLSRVRYIPDIVNIDQDGYNNEDLSWENAPIEHVKWDKYLCGPGRVFKDIPWWAFEHNLTRAELIEKFGEEIGEAIELDCCVDKDDLSHKDDEYTSELFKTAKVYEIWDKETKNVIWLCDAYLDMPLKIEKDPLKLINFFPIAQPIRAIEDSDCFEAVSLYDQYCDQADELNKVSARINKLISYLKLRAIYDPSLGPQISELFRGNDGDLIPADSSIKQIYDAGGIERAIWFAPISQIAAVVESLYAQREQCKQVIYELTGIADIMRGATNPSETKGAQDLKVAFGMTRLSRMQRDVQRYIRDLMNLQAEVICEQFSIDTLRQMTQVNLPTDAQIMPQMQMQMQQSIVARMQGQPAPPLPPKPTTWEDVKRAMSNDMQRTFAIDIETDSTIAAAQQEDAQDLSTVLSAVTMLFKEVGPLVQMGVLPFDAFKELLLMTARKFRMGNQVEDTIDQMEPPAQKEQQMPVQLQVEQLRQQGNQQELLVKAKIEQQKAEANERAAYAEQHAQSLQKKDEKDLEIMRNQYSFELEMAFEKMKQENAMVIENMRAEIKSQTDLIIAALDNKTKIEVAEIQANKGFII